MPRALINLDDIYTNNLGTFAKITNSVLPVSYPDEFFEELFELKSSNKKKTQETFFSKLAYYGETAVAAVKAKLLPSSKGGVLPAGVYIEVLAVLSAYRDKGIGSKLLEFIEQQCKDHFQHDIYVHVATDNSVALEWYKKKGFNQEGEILQGYYRDTTGSPDAFVMKKRV